MSTLWRGYGGCGPPAETATSLPLLRRMSEGMSQITGRRGGESARQRMSEWHHADNRAWLESSHARQREDPELTLFANMKITFQGGKGNHHLVPVLFPVDCNEALRKVSYLEVRLVTSQPGKRLPFSLYAALRHSCRWMACYQSHLCSCQSRKSRKVDSNENETQG